MAVPFYGDYDTTETVYIPFNTFSSDDPSASVTATTLLNTDCHIHKDGAVAQRTSSSGETLSIDFDTVTGNHLLALDLSDNTDAGFYAAGSTYQVRIEGATVDGANINAWIGAFSIGRMLRPTTAGRTLDVAATGEAGLDFGNVTGTLSGGEFAAGVFGAGAIRAADIATDAIGAAELAADAVAEIADAVWDEDATAHQTGGTFGQAIGDPGANTETMYDAVVTDAAGTNVAADIIAVKAETALILTDTGTTLDDHLTDIKGTGFVKDTHSLVDIEAYVDLIDDGTSGLAKIATDVAATLVDTAEIGAAGAGLTAVPWNAAWDAEVQSEVDDALVAQGLDHLVGAAVIGTDVTDNSIIAKLASKSATADWDSFNNTTDALEALADTSAPSAATIADAVWDEAQADHVAAGSFGVTATEIADILVDTAEIGAAGAGLTDLGGMSTAMKAEVNAEADTAISDAALATAANLATVDTVADAIKVVTDALGATAAANLALSAGVSGIITGAVETGGGPTTTVFQTDLAETTDDHYNGRVVIFTSGVLAGQASDITDYTGGTGTITVTAMTEAPSNTDTFIII